MTTQSQSDPKTLLTRFADAINAHDLDAIVSCFAPDYHDVEPAHPRRRILGGETEVRKNWGTVLQNVTDFTTEVRTIAAEGDVALIEHDGRVLDPMGHGCTCVASTSSGCATASSPGDVSISKASRRRGWISTSGCGEWPREKPHRKSDFQLTPTDGRTSVRRGFGAEDGPRGPEMYLRSRAAIT